jgi:hypothetical protein
MLAVGLLVLAVAVAVPAAAQTEPPRVKVTASSDRCADGLPVVDYTLANTQPTAVAVQAWWVADASLFDLADTHQLAPTPILVAGSFTLPLDFCATVTVYATATWPDSKVTTNASWAIPLADCALPAG